MKKSILMISLMTVAMAVFAIDYPTYKPITPSYGGGSTGNGTGDDDHTGTTYGGYSTTTSGGTTTYGEGSAISARGPKRANGYGPGTPNPTGYSDGDVWIDTNTYKRYKLINGVWVEIDDKGNPIEIGPQDSGSPIGSPLLMLLFAAMAAAVVAWRRKRIAC